MNATHLGLSLLLATLGARPATSQGPARPAPPGPGYSGTLPGPEGDKVMEALEGLETARFEPLLGPGPWTFGALTSPVPYVPGPSEKDLIRLGPLMIKGPHVELESPFCIWNIPCENDGDVNWLYEWATGDEHPELEDAPEPSANLRKTLRAFRRYGAVIRGLRVAAVPREDVIEDGSEPRVDLMLYNASGKPVEVEAQTTLRFGAASARLEFGKPGLEPNHIMLVPGESLNTSRVLHRLEWRIDGESASWADVLQAGEQELHVALELAADERGKRGTVESNPATVRVQVGGK